ncbi:Cytochrome b [Thalassolituus maritimus]|uniref:Cytochrome b n=1 Tax=Thalassolituus maritimus TaxID=484498 RepID=A0A1N7JJV9_9GAMM|nr:cytochrome b/b6 domain-containing protein [Thalassolituus maritimus]SIS49551.1 Cytochrome b [Thalassolituus maritimus]
MSEKTYVWDIFIRIFHWGLTVCLAGAWLSVEQGWMDWHQTFGLAALGLIIFRVLWGVAGPAYARFSHFIRSPKATLVYARDLLSGRESHYLSHNPLGALAVLGLLGLVGFQVISGLFATDDILFEGPLFAWVSYDTSLLLTELHEISFNILLGIVVLHILAVLFHQFVKKEGLIQGMVSGSKRSGQYADGPVNKKARAPLWAGLLSVALAAGAVALLLSL